MAFPITKKYLKKTCFSIRYKGSLRGYRSTPIFKKNTLDYDSFKEKFHTAYDYFSSEELDERLKKFFDGNYPYLCEMHNLGEQLKEKIFESEQKKLKKALF